MGSCTIWEYIVRQAISDEILVLYSASPRTIQEISSDIYTRQKKKMSMPLWRSLKDLILNVHNSNWYHFKACPMFFNMMGQALFLFQYTIHYRPLKLRFCREKNGQKSQNRQKCSFSAKLFFLLFFFLMVNPNNQLIKFTY